MSNYHIGTMHRKKHWANVYFHIAVPNETNSANPVRNYRDCVKADKGAGSEYPFVSPTENTQIQNGEIYEHHEIVRFASANMTDGEKRSAIDARYTDLAADIPNIIRAQYLYYGYDRTVA